MTLNSTLDVITDAYNPPLDALTFSPEEQGAIAAALRESHPWDVDNDFIASVKNKIRDHHLARHGNNCCYCRVNLYGGGYFMIDREHILPKSITEYRHLAYSAWNLSISCKRCNMQMKNDDVSFLLDKKNVGRFIDPENYLFIHPNFENYECFLERIAVQSGTKNIVRYHVVRDCEKARFTRKYFSLDALEVGSFDESQGLDDISRKLTSRVAAEVIEIAKSHGQ